ncbi:MAG TPA: Rpn family recombination-promoting nuclease/putative transposase [Polyangiaceae bacterium]|nr:Rpn family recombination-promoting nuclease/putative transposase [Polyangiaceae bacterium]
MSRSPHDALFKHTFSDPRHAEGALRSVLPQGLSRRFAWDTLERVPGSFVDAKLKDRHTDLLFRVERVDQVPLAPGASEAPRSALVYLLFEHQSTPHSLMAFRLTAYSVRIWEEWLKEHADARRLPAIVPVVLHHGAGGWTGARTLEDLYDLDADTLEAAGPHVLRMRFLLDDLGLETDEALRERATTALGRLVMYCLRHAREPAELVAGLRQWGTLVEEVMDAPDGAAALRTVLRYVLMVHPEEPEIVLEQLDAAMGDEKVKEALMTAGERLIQRGEARGERQGELRMLRKQLTLRFGPLTDAANARLEAADVPTLETWGERVLTAASLDEVFGG